MPRPSSLQLSTQQPSSLTPLWEESTHGDSTFTEIGPIVVEALDWVGLYKVDKVAISGPATITTECAICSPVTGQSQDILWMEENYR